MHGQDSCQKPITKLSENAGRARKTIPERGITAHSIPDKMWDQMWFQLSEKVILSFENKEINHLNGSGGGIHLRLLTNCFIVIYLSISPIIPPAIPPFRDLCDDWKFDRGKPFHLPRVAGQKGSLDASVEARLRGKPTCGRAPQFRRAKLTSPAMTDELTKRRIWRLPTAR